ncbi:MAG: AbrB/MazE/SpoVT family DNA-binding domain-containing protein [Candidatus Geothermarchaeales archaeon]
MTTTSSEEAPWEEDTVVFSGNIRRSGNSFVVTIPVELARRFSIEEGQKVTIVGMSRKTYFFEGLIGINLGVFKVVEKVYGLELKIRDGEKAAVQRAIDEVSERHAATSILYDEDEEGNTIAKILFGAIRKTLIRPKTREEVSEIAEELVREIEKTKAKVIGSEVYEEEVKWQLLDPSMIAKSPYGRSERINWTWEI